MLGVEAVARLAAVVPPPAEPVRGDGDWEEFAAVNGFEAPPDYRELIRRYGVGMFGEWLLLLEPFSPFETLVQRSEQDRQGFRGAQREFPGQLPDWPVWPDPGGFLPWAETIDGDIIGWRTVGPPAEWTTLFRGRQWEPAEFAMGAAEFLLRLADGTLAQQMGWAPAAEFPPVFSPRSGGPPRADPVPLSARVRFSALPQPHPAFHTLVDKRTRSQLPEGMKIASASTRTTPAANVHHGVNISFSPEREQWAKDWVMTLAAAIGAQVLEVHDLERRRIWTDLEGRPDPEPRPTG